MIKELDLTTDAEYDLEINRLVDLDQAVIAETFSGDTQVGVFDFSGFTGAMLVVKVRRNDDFVVFELNSNNNEIILGTGGEFQLQKAGSDIQARAGKYVYDMYLLDGAVKYAFLRGNFIINDYTTN